MMMTLALGLLINMFLIAASHPVLIMMLVIAQTLLICVMMWFFSSVAWISFILFLIFIGGLMVLFIYITSLASNEKLNISNILTQKNFILLTYFSFLLMTLAYFYPVKFYGPLILTAQIEMIFNQLLTPITMIIMLYLLVTLIVAVKIAKKMEGPLRNTMKSK